LSNLEILGGDGDPLPPTEFVKSLRAFDPALRVVWGARPYLRPCWVIERKVPPKLYYDTYFKGKDPELDRYAEQDMFSDTGTFIGKRLYDMMPDWHPVYFVVNRHGHKIDLGPHIIEHLRQNYERTLLGIPELSLKHLIIDRAKVEADKARRKEDRMDRAAREVMEHKTEIWKEYFGFSGQPAKVAEGSEINGEPINPVAAFKEDSCLVH
jgi:hypothetical protein